VINEADKIESPPLAAGFFPSSPGVGVPAAAENVEEE